MGKSKKIKEEIQELVDVEETGQVVVEETTEETPQELVEETTEEQSPEVPEETPQQVAEEEDPKLKTLKEFAQYWKENELGKQRVVKFEVARAIFNYWKQYTGRPEIFTGCSSCMSSKTIFMLKKCKENGIDLG